MCRAPVVYCSMYMYKHPVGKARVFHAVICVITLIFHEFYTYFHVY
jgi:hypothetical protein